MGKLADSFIFDGLDVDGGGQFRFHIDHILDDVDLAIIGDALSNGNNAFFTPLMLGGLLQLLLLRFLFHWVGGKVGKLLVRFELTAIPLQMGRTAIVLQEQKGQPWISLACLASSAFSQACR